MWASGKLHMGLSFSAYAILPRGKRPSSYGGGRTKTGLPTDVLPLRLVCHGRHSDLFVFKDRFIENNTTIVEGS
jgi:hypothetical protein